MKENYQDDDEHLDSEENLSAYKGKVKVSGLELAPIVQLVERSTENGKVVGSNPTRGIYTGSSSIGGTLALGVRGRWFDPSLPDCRLLNKLLAQLVRALLLQRRGREFDPHRA